MNKIFVRNIGDLGQGPLTSFYRFLHLGIKEEVSIIPSPLQAPILLKFNSTESEDKKLSLNLKRLAGDADFNDTGEFFEGDNSITFDQTELLANIESAQKIEDVEEKYKKIKNQNNFSNDDSFESIEPEFMADFATDDNNEYRSDYDSDYEDLEEDEFSHKKYFVRSYDEDSLQSQVDSLLYLYSNEIKLHGPLLSVEACKFYKVSYTIQVILPGEYICSLSDFLELEKKSGSVLSILDDAIKIAKDNKNINQEELYSQQYKRKNFKNSPKNLNIKQNEYNFGNKFINVVNFDPFSDLESEDENQEIVSYEVAQESEEHIEDQAEDLGYGSLVRIPRSFLLAEIPMMTNDGTFYINGCERIIVSQILRSPGVYFRKDYGPKLKPIYSATIISSKGAWTKIGLEKSLLSEEEMCRSKDAGFETGKEEGVSFRVGFIPKGSKPVGDTLCIYELIPFLGITYAEARDNLRYPSDLDAHLLTQSIADPISSESEEQKRLTFVSLFDKNSGCFSIGRGGRYRVNKKLGLNLPENITYLTSHDLIEIINGLLDLKYAGTDQDDIDHIQNKQIRCVGGQFQKHFRIGLYRMKKSSLPYGLIIPSDFKNQHDRYDTTLGVSPYLVTSAVREFFKASPIAQFMDQTNPLAAMTHKRRISVFGPNGLKRDNISTDIRDIHPSQYGRICPVETSEGENAGLVTSLALLARISSYGSIEAPYFFAKNSTIFLRSKPAFLNPEQESKTKVVFSGITLNKESQIVGEYTSAKENYFFSGVKSEQVNFVAISPLQILSLATSLIPFVEHNDANRALMGSNMQRQAVPLLFPQKPIVGTGLEAVAILSSDTVVKSYCQGMVLNSSATNIKVVDVSGQAIEYFLIKYRRSNQETSINQMPIVWVGETVFSGQVIADGPATEDGELALGVNLTIAYMPWEGYNYEDAIVVNERLFLEDCLTSVHIEEHEISLSYSRGEVFSRELPKHGAYASRHLDANGIAKIGSFIKEYDVLVGKLLGEEEELTPFGRLLKALKEGQKKAKKKQGEPLNEDNSLRKDSSLCAPRGSKGRVIEIRNTIEGKPKIEFFAREELKSFESFAHNFDNKSESFEDPEKLNSSSIIRIFIADIRKIQVGDKLSGRHGNKGIISRILSRQDMPYLPDGTPIDVILNPLGVPSRMNVGQIFESLLGLAGEKLGKRFKVYPFDEVYEAEASRILVNQKLKEASIKTEQNWLFDASFPGKICLGDGRTGEYFDNPVLVGKSYILKLIHLVEDKIHGRNVGPYAMITEQPLAGKAKDGGQRFGEMEVWALEAFGCSHILQELLTVKSDDIHGREDLYDAVVRDKIKPAPSISETFLVLIRELNALGLDFTLRKDKLSLNASFDNEEIDIFAELETRLKLRAIKKMNFQRTSPEILEQRRKQETQKLNFEESMTNIVKTYISKNDI